MTLDREDIEAIASTIIEKLFNNLTNLEDNRLPFDPITFEKALNAYLTRKDRDALKKYISMHKPV